MSIERYHTFGIFFEINKEIPCFITQYECSEDNSHFSSVIENKASFCPVCGKPVQKKQYETQKRFLNVWEIEKGAGLKEETLFGTMENPKEQLKYFSLNRKLENVLNVDVSDDYPCMLLMSPEKSPKDYIEDAFKNEDFEEIVDKLKTTYGEHFKIHFGIFTYNI